MWQLSAERARRCAPTRTLRRPVLRCESLEDRRVPATFLVTNAADSGSGSLRQAVLDANASAGADDIQFSGVTGTITLTSGELAVTDPVMISGPGATALAVSGNSQARVFRVNTSGAVAISGLTLTQGNVQYPNFGGAVQLEAGDLTLSGAAVTNNSAYFASGINAESGTSLTVRHTTIAGNTCNYYGSGIRVTGATVLVEGSTISGNRCYNSGGGGLYVINSTATVRNTTVANNSSNYNPGGGLYFIGGSGLFQRCTIAGNQTSSYYGGGLYINSAACTVQSTILAGNFGWDLYREYNAVLNVDHSLIQNLGGGINGTNSVNLFNVDPLLGPFSDNGGPTKTFPLSAGSPAIDAGSNPAGLANDQRGTGYPRLVGSDFDIGALEGAYDYAVINLNDAGPGSLRQAVLNANAHAGPDTIYFAKSLSGTISLTTGDIGLSESVSVVGITAGAVTVEGDGSNRPFTDLSSGALTLTAAGFNVKNSAGLTFPYAVTLVGNLAVDAGPAPVVFTNTLDLGPDNTYVLTAPSGVAVGTGGALIGRGKVDGSLTLRSGGVLSPGGMDYGLVEVTGNFGVEAGGTVRFQIGGDTVLVDGSADIGTATNFDLSLAPGFVPGPGLYLSTISDQSSVSATGRLNGLPNHRYVTVDGFRFQVRYNDEGPFLGLWANNAPAVNPNVLVTVPTILEDTPAASNPGMSVDNLVGTGGLHTDTQGTNPSGVAVIGTDVAHGSWEYSLDGGTTWTAFTLDGPDNATVLEADGAGKNRIRFLSNPDYYGRADLSFRAWDAADGQPSGTTGVDASAGGGNRAFSSDVATAAINVLAVNDPPVARNDAVTVIEDGGPYEIKVRDNDDSGPETGEVLTVATVTGPQHGVVSIAPDKKSVFYTPSPDYAGPDNFLYSISDGNGGSAFAAVEVTVENDAADRLEVVFSPGGVVFTEGGPTAKVDSTLKVGTADEGALLGARVRISGGYVPKKDVLALPDGAADPAIKAKFDAKTGTLTLAGVADPAAYQSALRAVVYNNMSPAPVAGDRKITVQLWDGGGLGDPTTKSIKVVAVNSRPVVALPATAVAAKVGKAVSALAGITLTDPDCAYMHGAAIVIGNSQAGDTLSVVTKGTGITANFSGGVLTLTGTASLKNYLKVLKSVKFLATGGPGVARTLSLTVTDGTDASLAVNRSVTVG